MKKLPITDGEFWIDHFYGGSSHPYFGVYEGNNLVCVCVYRKGAEEVLRRLAEAGISKKEVRNYLDEKEVHYDE